MPIYEFQCKMCDATFDELCRFDDTEDMFECSCGGKVKKLLSPPAFTPSLWGDETGKFGASGFYCVQAGRRFQNRREQDKWMTANGKVRVSNEEFDRLYGYDQEKLKKMDAESEKTQEYLKQHRTLIRRK